MCSPAKGATAKRPCLCGTSGKSKIIQTKPASPELCSKCKELVLNEDQIKCVMKKLLCCIKEGLAKSTHPNASVKCYVTYVQDVPTGNERGKYLALDLGGSRFRVLMLQLGDNKQADLTAEVYDLTQQQMTGEGSALFDYIADCIVAFLQKNGLEGEDLSLGFTFSFPLRQDGLAVGVLVRWTKGFTAAGVEGQNVVDLLNQALQRKNVSNVHVVAVLNDTTGTLMSCAWYAPNAKIGLIVGTGCNACYLENQSTAELFDEPDMGSGKVIINMELAAFGEKGELDCVQTCYDKMADKSSINPGQQPFEKMVSGMYLGEVVRLALARFTREGILFCGRPSDKLNTQGSFETRFISDIESDPPGCYDKVRSIISCDLGLKHYSEKDFINVRYICELFSRRAAHLVSAAMATLLNYLNDPCVTIGVDGSVYKLHPQFHNLMDEKIRQLIGPGIDFQLMLAEDGSGKGAALVAAVVAAREANAPPASA